MGHDLQQASKGNAMGDNQGQVKLHDGVRAVLDGERTGLKFDRYFTTEAVHPYDEVEW